MQIKKILINNRLSVWSISWNFTFQLFIICRYTLVKFVILFCYCYSLVILFNDFYFFSVCIQTLHCMLLLYWPVWLNGWVFVYELSRCGFESRSCQLNFRCGSCFEQKNAMNTKPSCFVIYVAAIIYMLLYNLYECNLRKLFFRKNLMIRA